MSTRKQLFAAFILALTLSGVGYYIAFAPISVSYMELATFERNWDRLSSLAVRNLRVYGEQGKPYAAVRAVISKNADPNDQLKVASSLRISGVDSRFAPDDDWGGPSLVVERAGGTLTQGEVNQILEAIQFSTDSWRPTDDLPRNVEIFVLNSKQSVEISDRIEKTFKFKIKVSGQNDVPQVRLQMAVRGNQITDANKIALTSREPVKLGDLFAGVQAADPDRWGFATIDLGIVAGQLLVSGVGLDGGDFVGAPLAWSETLPYTEREEYFLDVAGKHVTLQSRIYARVSALMMGSALDSWGITYVPPSEGTSSDELTIRTNDHGDRGGHVAAESTQIIAIRLPGGKEKVAGKPPAPSRVRRTFMEVIRLKNRAAQDLVPVLNYLVAPGTSIDPKKNNLVVKGSPQFIAEVREAALQLDAPPRKLQIEYFTASSLRGSPALAPGGSEGKRTEIGSNAPTLCALQGEQHATRFAEIIAGVDPEQVSQIQVLEGETRKLEQIISRLLGAGADTGNPNAQDLAASHRRIASQLELAAHPLSEKSLIVVVKSSQTDLTAGGSTAGASAHARGALGEWLYVDSSCVSKSEANRDERIPAIRLFVRVELL